MSAPVDVLKAMRVAEAYCYDAGASNAAQNMKAARAAVAELVEKVGAACDQWDSNLDRGMLPQHEMASHLRGLRAALARAQGVQS